MVDSTSSKAPAPKTRPGPTAHDFDELCGSHKKLQEYHLQLDQDVASLKTQLWAANVNLSKQTSSYTLLLESSQQLVTSAASSEVKLEEVNAEQTQMTAKHAAEFAELKAELAISQTEVLIQKISAEEQKAELRAHEQKQQQLTEMVEEHTAEIRAQALQQQRLAEVVEQQAAEFRAQKQMLEEFARQQQPPPSAAQKTTPAKAPPPPPPVPPQLMLRGPSNATTINASVSTSQNTSRALMLAELQRQHLSKALKQNQISESSSSDENSPKQPAEKISRVE